MRPVPNGAWSVDLKAKHQRLSLAIVAIIALLSAGTLAVFALKDKAAYFYSPADLKRDHVEAGRAIRLGGMVADKSIQRGADGTTVRFVVEDGADRVPVVFKGITPDLFKERSGVIAEGSMTADGQFVATNLLAKHDEKYMPPELAGKMHKTGEVKK
jgi:cytochrome c-type biogenesis protein CcmE